MLFVSLPVTTQRERLIDNFQHEAERLAAACDQVYISAFHESFPREQQELLGLALVALGSYGRRQQISGVSDSDVALYCTKIDYDNCFDKSITGPYEVSFEKFHSLVLAGLKDKQIIPEDYPERVPKTATHSDLSTFWRGYLDTLVECENYTNVLKKQKQQAFFIGLSTIVSSRILVGRSGFDPLDSVKELISDPDNLQKLITFTARYFDSLIGDTGTLSTVKNNIKERLQRLSQLGSTLIRVLEIAAIEGSEVVVPESIRELKQSFDKSSLSLSVLRRAHQAAAVNVHGRRGQPAETFMFSDRQAFAEKFKEIYPKINLDPLGWLYQTAEELDFNLKRLITFITEGDSHIDKYSSIELGRDPYLSNNVTSSLRALLALDPTFLPAYQNTRGVVSRFQYHCYTNFEHGLKAVERLDMLAKGLDPDQRFVKIFSSLTEDQKRVLYFATHFHDCAIKRENELCIKDPYWHAEEGAKIAMDAVAELGFAPEELRIIGQLIANHLCFKDVSKFAVHTIHTVLKSLPEDIRTDPAFINMLVLLTYADGRSTDPENWSIFRANHLYKTANSAHLFVIGKDAIESADSFTDQLLEGYFARRVGLRNKIQVVEFLNKLPDDFRELPQVSICDFLDLYSRYNGQPLIALAEHNLEPDKLDPTFKVDLLVVTKDRRYLASNIVEQITAAAFEIHSADFFTNSEGIVFNRLTFYHKSDRSEDLKKLETQIEKCLQKDSLELSTKISNKKFAADSIDLHLVNPRYPPSGKTFMLMIKTQNSKELLLRLLTGFNRVGLALTSCCINTEGEYVEDIFELSLNGRQESAGVSLETQQKLLEELKREFIAE